jgi:hypothetical protein
MNRTPAGSLCYIAFRTLERSLFTRQSTMVAGRVSPPPEAPVLAEPHPTRLSPRELRVSGSAFSCLRWEKLATVQDKSKPMAPTTRVPRMPMVLPNQPPKRAPKGMMPVTQNRKAPFIFPRRWLGVIACRMVQAKTVTAAPPALNAK